MKILKCEGCGKIVILEKESACPTKCCGENMVELVAGQTDGAAEKHVPVVEVDGNIITVTVGSVEHPMLDNHYINFILLVTEDGYQVKTLKPGDAPKAVFAIAPGKKAIAAYEYCNLHGLWKTEI